tara:strand:- start:2740 stop:3210 length:471 start_codon:yes stop_codon:yes gene_type:complete
MSQWTDTQNNTISNRMQECYIKKNEHLKASRIYDNLDKITGLPQIILSSVLSTTTLSQVNEEETSHRLAIFLATCSVFLAVLTSTTRFFEFSKMKESHKKTGLAYGKLERLLEFELARSEKQNYDTLFENTLSEYGTIRENSHLIPDYFPKKNLND